MLRVKFVPACCAACLMLIGCASSSDRFDAIDASMKRIEAEIAALNARVERSGGDDEIERALVQLKLERADLVRKGVLENNSAMASIDARIAAAKALQAERKVTR